MKEDYFMTAEKKMPGDPLVGLISSISWAITNFDKRFPGDPKGRALFVSPALSSVYDTRIIGGEFCIGFQNEMFDKMWHIPWKLSMVIMNEPGIYFCFATGAKPPNHYGMLRFYLRHSETKALLNYGRVKVCRISDSGDDMSWRPESHFYLPLKKIGAPDWDR